MNLVEYGRIILRRGWIALLLAIIAAGSAFFFSKTVTPVFRSTQVILIVPSRSDFGLTQAAVQTLNNRRAYLDSDLRAKEIIDDLLLDFDAAYLRSKTTISAQRDNLTMQIDVDLPSPDAETAGKLVSPIAAAWGQKLIDYQNELNQEANREDRIRAQPQDNPRLSQLAPRPMIYMAIGGIAGLFLGAVLIFVLEYLESNLIRRREDVEYGLEIKVLAAVPAE